MRAHTVLILARTAGLLLMLACAAVAVARTAGADTRLDGLLLLGVITGLTGAALLSLRQRRP